MQHRIDSTEVAYILVPNAKDRLPQAHFACENRHLHFANLWYPRTFKRKELSVNSK
jgi:hypothetical protein